jgi:hypothetical protein
MEFGSQRHRVAAVSMLVVLQRAMIVMRGITGFARIMVMSGMLLFVKRNHHLAWIRRKRTDLQAGQDGDP